MKYNEINKYGANRQFNTTEKQVVKGLQSAGYGLAQIINVIELIYWHIAQGEKVVSANIDQKELNIKFSSAHKYHIVKGV